MFCISIYYTSALSLHIESTNSMIHIVTGEVMTGYYILCMPMLLTIGFSPEAQETASKLHITT